MKKSEKASQTAIVTAAIRASHQIYDSPLILIDSYSKYFLNSLWRTVIHSKWLYRFITNVLLKSVLPIRSQVLIRARYCEDIFFANKYLKQCVILGSGYDTLAMRIKSKTVTFYELDKKEILERKNAIITKNGLSAKAIFVNYDFQDDHMAQSLVQAGFKPDETSLFTWLGVTYYLTEDAIVKTLTSLHQIMSQDSRLLLDYGIDDKLLDDQTRSDVTAMKKFVAARGEPMTSFFNPKDFEKIIKSIGFAIDEELTDSDMKRRYLQNNNISFSGFSRLVLLKKIV